MKNTKTTLMELTKQYRSVLMKCILLNGFILGFSVPAFAEPNIDDFLKTSSVSTIFKDLEITTSSEVQGNYTGEWSGGLNHKHIYQGSITGTDTSRINVDFDHVALYLNVDNQGLETGNFSVKNTKFNADTSAITGGRFIIRQEDEVNVVEGTKVEFENSEVYLKDSDIESKGDMVIKGTNLTYSCQNCYQYNEDGSFDDVGDNILMGHNISITNGSQVILGDKTRQTTLEKAEESYMGANHNLIINGSSVVLNGKSMLAYEGEMEECMLLEPPTIIQNGVGAIAISNGSTLTFNDESSLKIGMEEDDDGDPMDSRAALSIADSTINLNDHAKIEFALVNKEETTINNSVINMSGNSSMSLNDMTLNAESEINMKDNSSVVADNVILNDSDINMEDNSVLDVYNVRFDGGIIYSSDNSKVYIKDDRGANSLTLNGTTITTSIFSNSISNFVKFLGTVRFSGLFDPATAEVGDGTAETLLTKDNYDDEITYNLNNAGTLAYTKDSYLYDLTKHNGTYGKNTINFKGGTLDLRNGSATAIYLASLSLADGTSSSIYADVDLANEKMDTLTADGISVGTGAKLNIAGLNLISDATNEKTSIIFTENENLKTATTYTGKTTGLKALSPVYTYDVAYNDGIFEFTRLGSGESSNDYNPAVYSSTTVSQNVGLLSSNINSIAFAGLSGENSSPQGRSGGDLPAMGNTWVKLVGFDENVDFDSFQTIDSQVFSVIGGMTTDKVNLGSSDMTFGAYAGYLNGKQKYTGNKVEQNGGYFGLSTSWTKDRIFVDGTINAGFIRNEAEHSFGTDKYNTYWTGAAAKVGYNYALTNTLSFVPSFYAGYTIVDTKDYTSVSGVRIENDKTHIFEFAPGLKLSQQFNNDWTGFIQGKYAILKNHGGDVTADDIALPNISTDNYAEYGIGLDKVLTDNWTLSLTANRRDGGRQGWNGSVEFKYNF